MTKRIRKVNLDKMEDSQVDEVGEKIVKKITDITDEAVKKVNKILSIYGMTAKMQIAIDRQK